MGVTYQRARDGLIIENGYPHTFTPEDLDELARFLDEFEWVLPLRDIAARGVQEPGVLALRHDVDHSIEHAVRFAEWEYDLGYRGSYYVLADAWYADRPGFADRLREIVDLGHEVGIHVDAVSAAWGDEGVTASNVLTRQLDKLRDRGVEIVGCSAHGTSLFYSHGVHNTDIWAAGLAPAEFGLTYAAELLLAGALEVSDNRGKFGGKSSMRRSTPLTSPLEREPRLRYHLLLHPEHWEIP